MRYLMKATHLRLTLSVPFVAAFAIAFPEVAMTAITVKAHRETGGDDNEQNVVIFVIGRGGAEEERRTPGLRPGVRFVQGWSGPAS